MSYASIRFKIGTAERPTLTACLFGAVHLLVDLASVSALYTCVRSGLLSQGWVAAIVLGYDFVAFASQMFLGYALDRLGLAGPAAAAGCLLTALGAWLTPLPVAAVACVAVGNALFHVAGGSICLRLDRDRAAWAGIFVAPGAIGLFLGKQFGGTPLFQPWALTLLLCSAAPAGIFLRLPRRAEKPPLPGVKGFGLVAAALLLTVLLRSLVGFSVSYPWVSGWPQALAMTLAAFAGKALGGVLGDRIGWRAASVAGLLASAPLLAFGAGVPALALAGVLCFNLTMAITLAGTAYLLPGYEGLAFGLTATAVVIGVAPSAVTRWTPALGSPYAVAALILLSAAALWLALGRLGQCKEPVIRAKSMKEEMYDAQ